MLAWLSHGVVVPSVHDFQTLRIIVLTLMPAFAGPLLGLSLLGEGMTVKSIELLTALEVENAKPKDGKPIMLNDGRGLYLQVTPSKIVGNPPAKPAKSWAFLYRHAGGKKGLIGLGSLRDTTLKEARELAKQQRYLIDSGKRPKG